MLVSLSSIRAKLIGAFAVMTVLIATLGAVSFWGASQLTGSVNNLANGILPRVALAETLRGDIFNTRVSVLSHLAAETDADRDAQRSIFDERSGIVTTDIAKYEAIARTAEEIALIAELKETWNSYITQVPDIMAMSDNGQQTLAYQTNNQRLKPLALANAEVAEKLADHNRTESEKATVAADQLSSLINVILISGVLIAIAVTCSFATLIIRTIARGIDDIIRPMHALAAGDLSVDVPMRNAKTELGKIADAVEVFKLNMIKGRELEDEKVAAQHRSAADARMMAELQSEIAVVVEAGIDGDFTKRVVSRFEDPKLAELAGGVNVLVETVQNGLGETSRVLSAMANAELTERVNGNYKGAFEQLKSDTNSVARRLTDIMMQLRGTSASLKTATGEILAGANDLSERTTKQAAAIEETSAAIEQISSTVKINAEQAQQASVETTAAAQMATEGGRVMRDATQAMDKITASSARISNIIEMIDDIAFQTNLLALNASVEAARAGDAGKGFAVVAVEVRRLAQNAANASAEIKVLIEQSVKEVDGGARLVDEASSKLNSILNAVQHNSELMNSISIASREQASSIQEVMTAIVQMDEMTQHNAALVEETNAAIEQTEAQANDLDKIINVFVLRDRTAASTVSHEQQQNEPGAWQFVDKVTTAVRSIGNGGSAVLDMRSWRKG